MDMDQEIIQKMYKRGVSRLSPIFKEDSFTRVDSTDDIVFYKKDRLVNHLDDRALATVRSIIGSLVIEENSRILDLMAGWDSHIPDHIHPAEVIGLGLNENELRINKSLNRYVLHDLNKEPQLPFPRDYFDIVINTVSVDYMISPVQVFEEVGKILKPGGMFLVIFSNRMFPQKAVKVWKESSEDERIILVEEFFRGAGIFERPLIYISKGKPRPDDKYSDIIKLSDPVYALYAEKKGGNPFRIKRPVIKPDSAEDDNKEGFEGRGG
jgi:SAM-dependent methyltransferase